MQISPVTVPVGPVQMPFVVCLDPQPFEVQSNIDVLGHVQIRLLLPLKIPLLNYKSMF